MFLLYLHPRRSLEEKGRNLSHYFLSSQVVGPSISQTSITRHPGGRSPTPNNPSKHNCAQEDSNEDKHHTTSSLWHFGLLPPSLHRDLPN